MDLMNSASQKPADVPKKHASASSSKASKDRPAAPARDLASSHLECCLFRFLTLIILYPHRDLTLQNKNIIFYWVYSSIMFNLCIICSHVARQWAFSNSSSNFCFFCMTWPCRVIILSVPALRAGQFF